ncbi:hypothetical protein N0V82_004652 [Gnomoniopsis sp. IMI 355080]|nr:hypothetical protein N0V82_004652 [Gnomoniopsis sp. IMI 355080]
MSMDDMEEKRAHDGTVEPVKSSDKCDKQVEINAALARLSRDWDDVTRDNDTQDAIIITGKDASEHLLSLGDDHDPALTFRSIVLATVLSCFSAVMAQIYYFKPTMVLISGTFIVLLAYFLGNAWATFLPRGDRHEVLWRSKGGTGKPPLWIRFLLFLNPSEWGLKEHAICSITATSASNTADIIQVFAAQDLFYDMPLNGTTVVLAVISIALFGYGISGLIRPLAVWDVEAVYWTSLPTVKTLQGLHWQKIRSSKPLRFFWYAFGSMFAYAMLGIYYSNTWDAKSFPFMSTSLQSANGSAYPSASIFPGGNLNHTTLAEFGVPRMSGTFAYGILMSNAAVSVP